MTADGAEVFFIRVLTNPGKNNVRRSSEDNFLIGLAFKTLDARQRLVFKLESGSVLIEFWKAMEISGPIESGSPWKIKDLLNSMKGNLSK